MKREKKLLTRRTVKHKTKKRTDKKETNAALIKPCATKVIYLDNNGTTRICKDSIKAMVIWLDARANPSSDSIVAKKSKELLDCARKYILKHCGTSQNKYTVIFTSGASESNCFILRAVTESYWRCTNKKPHIITSATEHKSIIKCCNSLKTSGSADITFIEPNAYGCISPELIKKSITSRTALISIMASNNEIGCINNIKNIGAVAHAKNIPFHTDAVQSFGKYKISLPKNNIDALSSSFHKLYGPMGIGLLIISNDLISGYGITGQISGTQQSELRGGTENVPAIAGAIAALKHTFTDRDKKNNKLATLKKQLLYELEQSIPRGKYENYFAKKKPTRNEFFLFGPVPNDNTRVPNVLPNTALLCFVKNAAPKSQASNNNTFCNINLKKGLSRKNIIVSIGSACSTTSTHASHVMYAIKAPDIVRQGVVRVSMSDSTTKAEISTFVKELVICVKKQMTV